jgi:D-alanine-D-alanine ligase-like ATP-grasp enzyme
MIVSKDNTPTDTINFDILGPMSSVHQASCPDCGNAPVAHQFQKISVVMDIGIEHLNNFGRPLMNFIEPKVDRFVDKYFPRLFKALAGVGLGKIISIPDDVMVMRERVFWEEGRKRGIDVWGYRLIKTGNTISVATHDGKSIVFDTIPRPKHGNEWMDDKDKLREHLPGYGIPMAKGGVCSSFEEACVLFDRSTPPVIAKPNRGSRSRHTTTHVDTKEELRVAFEKAQQLSPWVIIEEELVGLVYRGTVIGGKVIGILRREPALVTGDGTHTVRELIEIENRNPLRKGPIFHEIQVHDPEHDKELARHGMTLESVPPEGMLVTLSQKASRGLGGGATDVTDETHPDIIRILEQVAEIVEDPLIGIDFIVEDVTRSWKEQPRSGVLECNSAPFIDLHLSPLHGKPRNTPGALWDLIFPSAKGT